MGPSENRQALVAIVDALIVVIGNAITLWIAPKYWQFAIAVTGLLQPVAWFLILHYTAVKAVRIHTNGKQTPQPK